VQNRTIPELLGIGMMDADSATPRSPKKPDHAKLSVQNTLLLAAAFGLAAGFLELVGLVLTKHLLHTTEYYKQGSFFPWALPVANLAILMVPGLFVAGLNWLRPGLFPLRGAAWLLTTLALWGFILNMPMAGWAGLLLAAGLGRPIGRIILSLLSRSPRRIRLTAAALFGLLATIAAVSIGGQAVVLYTTMARLPLPPSEAANVLLLVMDTVRAESLSLHGYKRDTTPHLSRWAQRGVKFDWAMAPACWTFPSHASFFTGRWPYQLGSHWQHVLDTPLPTLAEFLRGRGLLTSGFAANTSYLSYESGVNRGFIHYEDYILSPRTILATSAMGRWIADNVLRPADFYSRKWQMFKSRDARHTNDAFLDWLTRNQSSKRPFFAFLNYIDAHGPYLVPKSQRTHFGVQPESAGEYQMLLDSWNIDKTNLSRRDLALLRDGYDDCIANLDQQIGALLDELDQRGTLRNTLVIVTSDHGEEFGEHRVFDHGFSLYLYESHVPLLMISPALPPGRTITAPVSLRDLPATVVDVLGMAAGSPFPGQSLRELWHPESAAGRSQPTMALSDAFFPSTDLDPRRGRGPTQRGYTMSLLTDGWHYIRDGTGAEALYDLKKDPRESLNAIRTAQDPVALVSGFRRSLLRTFTDGPVSPERESEFVKKFRRSLEFLVPNSLSNP
jgi:arylsulfatase A-like enzyme